MFKQLIGGNEDRPKKKRKPSAEMIKDFAKTHNALLKAGKIKLGKR